MTPGDIALAPERKEAQTIKPPSLPVAQPISVEEFERATKDKPFTKFEGRRVFGDVAGIADFFDVPLYYYCKCECLDLSKPEDRIRYSDLVCTLAAPDTPLTLIWQERVVNGGSMIMYITYSEQVRIMGFK